LLKKKEGQSTYGGDATPYLNAPGFIKKHGAVGLYSSIFDSKLNVDSAILLTSCVGPYLDTSEFTMPDIIYDSHYTGDLASFILDEVFRKDKRGGNLLLKKNTGTQQYLLKPDS